ncbi:MAG: DNA alkylation repair protein, partial [Rickettsiales bacterium]|nr:DNA alkylation repair protein [Rickettsiales bacterium]
MYDKVRRELISLADTKYKTFSLRLMPGVEEKRFLGVRTPLLRKIAKLMVKEGVWLEYMESNKNEYFEEIMLEGMIVGIVKIDLRTRFDYMKNFLEKIDNWAICDMFC